MMTVAKFNPARSDDPRTLVGAKRGALAAVATAGGVLSLANPEGVELIVTRLIIRVTTASSVAATVDAGIAANGTTLADTLIDGLSVAATGVFDNIEDAGTNGEASVVWGTSEFLTISQASGDVTGLVGFAYVEYVRAVATPDT